MRKSRVRGIPESELSRWFERQKRVLPWRDSPTLYRVWVSEIMLQQTQVVTVVPYFERFLKAFPDVESLARAPEEEVLRLWAGLGYYSRARNLRSGARKIVAEGWPKDRAGWLEIPGVGEYTAGAVLSIALDKPEAILDGNVERVLSRLHRVDREKGDAAYKARLWELAREAVSRAQAAGVRPSVLNQALMELGATVCSPKAPRCEDCPVTDACAARLANRATEYPPRRKPKEWIAVEEELHCVLDGKGRVLVRLRESGEWRAGLWDLVERKPARARRLGSVESRHIVTRHKIVRTTQVWRLDARDSAGASAAKCGGRLRWISIADPEVAVGSALRKTLEQVRETFPGA